MPPLSGNDPLIREMSPSSEGGNAPTLGGNASSIEGNNTYYLGAMPPLLGDNATQCFLSRAARALEPSSQNKEIERMVTLRCVQATTQRLTTRTTTTTTVKKNISEKISPHIQLQHSLVRSCVLCTHY